MLRCLSFFLLASCTSESPRLGLSVHDSSAAKRMLRKQRDVTAAHKAECAQYATPCDCTVEGCGWSSFERKCVAGGKTDCFECPNPLMCGDETCMRAVMDDEDVKAAQRAGKECIADDNDMAVCLCDPNIGDLLESKIREASCCDANELFQQMCYDRKCDAVPPASSDGSHLDRSTGHADGCRTITEPCECGLMPGCGWKSGSDGGMCVTGGTTDCEECPHSLLCNEQSKCTRNLFKNPDVLEMINRAKVCVQSERDSMDYCMRNAGPDLANMIKNVEDDGDTIDCCEDNKYFTMICEGPETTTTPAPTEAPAPEEEKPPEPEPEPEEEKEEEPEGTTTTTTTTEDLMARIERMAKEYGLVPEDEEGGDGDGDADDGEGGDGGGDGEGGDGSGGDGDGDGSGGGGDGSGGGGGGDADSAAAGGGAAVDGAAGSAAMDASAKATADQVRDQNDMRLAANEEEVPPRKMST